MTDIDYNTIAQNLLTDEEKLNDIMVKCQNETDNVSPYVMALYHNLCGTVEKRNYFYNIAIERGNVDAMLDVGSYFEESNPELMIKYLTMAGEINGSGYYKLAIWADKLSNYELMEQYYNLAFEKGYIIAMYNLGFFYQYVIEDSGKAHNIYLKGVNEGCSNCMWALGLLYGEEDDLSFLVDASPVYNSTIENAIYYFKMSVDSGNIFGMQYLAEFYSEIIEDYDEALYYYDMAIENDNLICLEYKGDIYYKLNLYDLMKESYEITLEIFGPDNEDQKNICCRVAKKLGVYYQYIEKNYSKMFEYYNTARVSNPDDNEIPMYLAHYFKDILNDMANWENMMIMSIKKGNHYAYEELIKHCCETQNPITIYKALKPYLNPNSLQCNGQKSI